MNISAWSLRTSFLGILTKKNQHLLEKRNFSCMARAKAEKNETEKKEKKKRTGKKRGRKVKKEVRSGLCVCVPANPLG